MLLIMVFKVGKSSNCRIPVAPSLSCLFLIQTHKKIDREKQKVVMFSGEKSDENAKRIQSPHTQLQTRQSEGKLGHQYCFVVHPADTIHTPIQPLRMYARPRSNIYLPSTRLHQPATYNTVVQKHPNFY